MERAIPLAGGTYRHTDLSLTAQRTINFWPQKQDAGNEKALYVLESFPGLKPFSSGSGVHRGTFEHLGITYTLRATTLESVNSEGIRTTLGTIPGDSRAVFDGFGQGIVLTVEGIPYWWDGATLTTGIDVDFETPQAVTVINNQAIYDGDEGRFCISDVGAPLTINALNYGSAEYQADVLVRPYAFLTNIYMMGANSIEQHWNNPQVEQPPVSRIEGGAVNIGLGAKHSVANDGQVIYLFGSDRQVYSLLGASAVPLLPKVIAREIQSFAVVSDAVGWTMCLDGQWLYVLKFPTADRTFIYPKRGEWFELSSGTSGGRYFGDGYAYCFGKHLIADEFGNIFELDNATFSENSEAIRRVRTLAPVHGGLFGAPGKQIEISSFRLVGKTGTGILSGQGSDPMVSLEYSPDGENFSSEIWGSVGRMGVLTEIVFDIGQAYDNWIFRITSSDPVYSNWHAAAIEMEICP